MGKLITWVGLWLSLNQTVPVRPFILTPQPNVEATAIIKIGKLEFTTVYIQPLRAPNAPIVDIGIGFKVF